MKFLVDIPGYSKLSGGIQRMLELNEILQEYGESELHLPNDIYPESFDYIITYSDNPRINELCSIAEYRKAKVIVYQLSYGMCLERERKVVDHPDTIVCCSTRHIQKKIIADTLSNKNTHYIGHSQEHTTENFFPEDAFHEYDVAIMIHKAPDKQFLKAFSYCKAQGMRIILFGGRNNNFSFEGAERVFLNADVSRMRWIFSNAKKYLSLSTTEGLNRPGVEAMLCGCKPYIIDGCEIYKDGKNCKKIKKVEEILDNFEIMEYNAIKDELKEYTWDKVMTRLGEVLNVEFEKSTKSNV